MTPRTTFEVCERLLNDAFAEKLLRRAMPELYAPTPDSREQPYYGRFVRVVQGGTVARAFYRAVVDHHSGVEYGTYDAQLTPDVALREFADDAWGPSELAYNDYVEPRTVAVVVAQSEKTLEAELARVGRLLSCPNRTGCYRLVLLLPDTLKGYGTDLFRAQGVVVIYMEDLLK